MLQKGDVIALGGRLEEMTQNLGLIGPEVPDSKALNIPLDQAEILVTNKEVVGKELKELRNADFAGQVALHHIERARRAHPDGPQHQARALRRAVRRRGRSRRSTRPPRVLGKIARPSTSTDLLTLALGMILGFLIGAITFPLAGSKVGLGNAGGLLVSGVIVSSIVSRLRFFGSTPNAARNILEDLGLVVFIAIVGVNAGAGLITQLTGAVALKIFIAGFIVTTIPPILVWAIGYHMDEDQSGGADGRRGGRALALRPGARGRQGDRQLGAVDRLPGRLRGVRRAADGVRLPRDGDDEVRDGGGEAPARRLARLL